MTYHATGSAGVPQALGTLATARYPIPAFPYPNLKMTAARGFATMEESRAAANECLRRGSQINGIGAEVLFSPSYRPVARASYNATYANQFATSRWSNVDPCRVKDMRPFPPCLTLTWLRTLSRCVYGSGLTASQIDYCKAVAPLLGTPACAGVTTGSPVPDCLTEKMIDSIAYCERYPNPHTGSDRGLSAECWGMQKDIAWWSQFTTKDPCCYDDETFHAYSECRLYPNHTVSLPGAGSVRCADLRGHSRWNARKEIPSCNNIYRLPDCLEDEAYDANTACLQDPSSSSTCGQPSQGTPWQWIIDRPACSGKERLEECFSDNQFDDVSACLRDPTASSICGQTWRGNPWAEIVATPACSGKQRITCFDDQIFDDITACLLDPGVDPACGQPAEGLSWQEIVATPACNAPRSRGVPACLPAELFDHVTDCLETPSGSGCPELRSGQWWKTVKEREGCAADCVRDDVFNQVTECLLDYSSLPRKLQQRCDKWMSNADWESRVEIPACSGMTRAWPPAPPPPAPAPPPVILAEPEPEPIIVEEGEEGFGMWGLLALIAIGGGGAYYYSTRKKN